MSERTLYTLTALGKAAILVEHHSFLEVLSFLTQSIAIRTSKCDILADLLTPVASVKYKVQVVDAC